MAKLKNVGYILRKAKSGRIIVKLQVEVKEGTMLYDKKGRKVGLVREVFGPVSSPYASLEPRTDRIRGMIGDLVYAREEEKKKEVKKIGA